ncbi:MAG: dITP/XTP pyrophosphatase [Pseudomonadota bacterium]|jgi:XTP/dITP diphosphohydrolase
MRWVLASGNAGKAQEFMRLCRGFSTDWSSLDLVLQSSLGVEPTDEPFETFVENGLRKARHAAQLTGLPALADDSGLVVHALGGAPGVQSARYLKERGCQGLLDDLLSQRATVRDAHFVCCLVFVRHAHDPDPVIAMGRWHGQVSDAFKGGQGFGYDPVFLDTELGLTAAQMTPDQKDARSHRGKAFVELMNQLRSEQAPLLRPGT